MSPSCCRLSLLALPILLLASPLTLDAQQATHVGDPAAGAKEAAANPLPRTDLHGDPLPIGALARMGTVRWRHHDDSAYSLTFTPDGNTLISGGRDKTIRFWDARSGR